MKQLTLFLPGDRLGKLQLIANLADGNLHDMVVALIDAFIVEREAAISGATPPEVVAMYLEKGGLG